MIFGQLTSSHSCSRTYLKTIMQGTSFSKFQHAHLRGKSTESTFYEVIITVEQSLYSKQHSLASFLDVEGTFSNISTKAIKETLIRIWLDGYLTHWIVSMQKTRRTQSDLGDSHLTRAVGGDTSHGGDISPVLWLMLIDQILNIFDRSGVKVVVYANDLGIFASRAWPFIELHEIMQDALEKVCGFNIKRRIKKVGIALYVCKGDICKEMGSTTEDGSLDVHNRDLFHPTVRFYWVVAGAEQKIQ